MAWVIWFWLLITVFADLFRRRDTSGWAKVGWVVFVILLPYLGVLVYLLVEHGGMAERNQKAAEASQRSSTPTSSRSRRPTRPSRSPRPRRCSPTGRSPRRSSTRSSRRRSPSGRTGAPVAARRVTASAAIEYDLWRQTLADGDVTTVYCVRHPRAATAVRVLHFPEPRRLDVWCVANGVDEAIVGGFFLRDPYRPLGELWIDGRPVASRGDRRPVRTAARLGRGRRRRRSAGRAGRALDRPRRRPRAGGAAAGRRRRRSCSATTIARASRPTSAQFDSDITDGRHPRAALGIGGDRLLAVACDGRRSRVDGGLSMLELAELMVELGAESAINLDGRRLDHARPSRPPAQPSLLDAGPAGAGVANDRQRARVRAATVNQTRSGLRGGRFAGGGADRARRAACRA